MAEFYVYYYTNPYTDEVCYVGKGKNKRAFAHVTGSTNTRLKRLITKAGKDGIDMRPSFMLTGLSDKQACAAEIFWIAVIGRKDQNKGSLYNLTDGGEGPLGFKPTKELIEKRAAANRGKKRSQEAIESYKHAAAQRSTEHYTKYRTDEYKKKIAESMKKVWAKRKESSYE